MNARVICGAVHDVAINCDAICRLEPDHDGDHVDPSVVYRWSRTPDADDAFDRLLHNIAELARNVHDISTAALALDRRTHGDDAQLVKKEP